MVRPSIVRCLTLILGTALLPAQDWAQFRGIDSQGIAHGKALPQTFGADNVRWRVALTGQGHSSPILWGDRLILTQMGKAAGTRDVVCFDAASGAPTWTHTSEFTAHHQHKLNSFASSTPAADADGVYIVWTSGPDLVALALDHQGKPRWKKTLGTHRAQHGSGASPILHGDLLVVANDNEGAESFLIAVDRETGATRWKVGRQDSKERGSYTCPVPYRPAKGAPYLLFTSQTHGLTAVDPANGKLRFEWNPEFKQRCVGTPCLSGDQLFYATGSGGSGRECAFVRLPSTADGEPQPTHSMRRSIPYVPCAIALQGRFYMFNDGGIASCVAADSGEVVWRERLVGTFFSSPVSDGQTIYIVDRAGELFSLRPGAKPEVLGTFELGGTVHATPAIAHGCLYARTAEQLVCLGPPLRAGASDQPPPRTRKPK